MLRSTRLVSITLSLIILCSLAPTLSASPQTSIGFDLDIMSRIEAVFSSLSNVFFGSSNHQDRRPTDALESEIESLTSTGDVQEVPTSTTSEATPAAEPNGYTNDSEDGSGS